jgi:uncharacterized protein (TIGR04206 family)
VRRRLALLAGLGLLPWVVAVYPEGAYAVFSFGLVDRAGVTFLPTFVRGAGPAPRALLAWPAAGLCWLAGLGAVLGRARPKMSAALFGLAAFSAFRFALWVGARGDYTAVPVGAVILGGAAVYLYGAER